MRIVTKQSLIAPAIKSFFNNYPRYKNGPFYTIEKYNRMLTLDPTNCTVEQFNEAMGPNMWADNRCDECTRDCDTLVHIGREPDYDVRWLCLCQECLQSAGNLLSVGIL